MVTMRRRRPPIGGFCPIELSADSRPTRGWHDPDGDRPTVGPPPDKPILTVAITCHALLRRFILLRPYKGLLPVRSSSSDWRGRSKEPIHPRRTRRHSANPSLGLAFNMHETARRRRAGEMERREALIFRPGILPLKSLSSTLRSSPAFGARRPSY